MFVRQVGEEVEKSASARSFTSRRKIAELTRLDAVRQILEQSHRAAFILSSVITSV